MSTVFSLRDRIVVTGIGVVTPLGSDLDVFWNHLTDTDFPAHSGRIDFSGHIDDFGSLSTQAKRVIRKSLKLMNRETQLGVAAAQHAITLSGLVDAGYDSDRVGVCFGAGNVEIRPSDFAAGVQACREALDEFDIHCWGNYGIPQVDPLWILRVLPNMPACHVAIANDLRGPNNTITQAGVATNMALAEARNAILDGDADAMVVGGTGTNFREASRCTTAGNWMPAEAAAAFVIEPMESAIERGATLLGEILATGSATIIQRRHHGRPHDAARAAVAGALHRSGIRAESIGHINTDANCVDFGDVTESLNPPAIVSLKQRTGDAAAGSSAMEIAASLLAVQKGCPPTASNANDRPCGSVAVNVNAMENGLASCVVVGQVKSNLAA